MATPVTSGSFDLSNASVDTMLLALGVTDADLERIRDYWEYVSPRMDAYVDAWLSWMQTNDSWSDYFSNEERRTKLRQTQNEYWGLFFSGKVDDEYIKNRRWVGDSNAKIGITPTEYLASINSSLQILTEDIYEGDAEDPAPVARTLSMYKLAQLDIDISDTISFVQ